MVIKQIYSFSNNRQIWRLIPSDTGKIVIEERDTENKEVFFNCLEISSGEKIFSELQFEEKFWVGIEAVDNDTIYFHKFAKPDMPGHQGVIAFDIKSKNILWENPDYSFLFIESDKIYCYKSHFEGRNFFTIDRNSGEKIEDLGSDVSEINRLRDAALSKQSYKDYIFPKTYYSDDIYDERITKIFSEFKNEKVIAGNIEYAIYGEVLFFNFHEVLDNGSLRNILRAFGLKNNKQIMEEVLISETKAYVPDSFFFRQNLMFLLEEKNRLVVYELKS
jgi:hypothetical protein